MRGILLLSSRRRPWRRNPFKLWRRDIRGVFGNMIGELATDDHGLSVGPCVASMRDPERRLLPFRVVLFAFSRYSLIRPKLPSASDAGRLTDGVAGGGVWKSLSTGVAASPGDAAGVTRAFGLRPKPLSFATVERCSE